MAGRITRRAGVALACVLPSVTPVAAYAQRPLLSRPPSASPLVLDHVTVVDVEHGTLLPAQRVVIVGTRIHALGPATTVPLPAGAQVVDGAGKYVIPGLWDMHIHGMRATQAVYPLLLASGVTGFRDAGSDVPLDTLRQWRREIVAGTRIGPPRQLFSGPALDAASKCTLGADGKRHTRGGPQHLCVDNPVKVVDSLQAAGADIIKTYDLTREAYLAIAAEARRVGIPFGGHLDPSAKISAIEASDSGARILDHTTMTGDLFVRCLQQPSSLAQCQPVGERFRRNGTWWAPTLVVGGMMGLGMKQAMGLQQSIGAFLSTPRLYGPASEAILARLLRFTQQFWAGAAVESRTWLRDSAGAARIPSGDSTGFDLVRRAGIPLLAGTDASGEDMLTGMPPGFALHAELALLVAEGLTPLEALQTATLNPARAFQATDSLGTVAAGKLADLVLLDANPLVDITNTTAIRAVVANGRYFDRVTLDTLIADARAWAKQQLSPAGRQH